MQPNVTNAKIGWLARKVKGYVRTALNQANRGLLLINIPKRLLIPGFVTGWQAAF